MINNHSVSKTIDESPEHALSKEAIKAMLTSMKMVFINMHGTYAVKVLGAGNITSKNRDDISFNAVKRVEAIFDKSLDNDGSSPAADILTVVAIELCEDFLSVAKKGK